MTDDHIDSAGRPCPVCLTPNASATLYMKESIDPSRMSGLSFASRKPPEFMSHRMVQCAVCKLVYVPEPPSAHELAGAYHDAAYDSVEEAEDAAAAYIQAIAPVFRALGQVESALEIGTGTGVFLEELKAVGVSRLVGIEPSIAAISAAPLHRKTWIREGVFRECDFQPGSFDLVCCFMTMEHVPDPAEIASAALRLLRPGGAFVTVTHDYRSFVNRVLGRRSPIIDIEHMQIFCDAALRVMFDTAGYREIKVKAFANRYRLNYWLRLAPVPEGVKSVLMRVLSFTGMGRIKISINVGNSMAVGFKSV